MIISDDNYGIDSISKSCGSGNVKVMTVRISLSELIKQKWYLDFVSKKFNEEIEYEKLIFGGGAGL
jgi:hypothetical protein